jgi:Flp pilus assembly protein TadB
VTGFDPGVLLAVLLGGAFGGAVLLLIAGIRGVEPRGPRPPSRASRLLAALRTRAVVTRVAGGFGAAVMTLLLTGWPVAAVGAAALVIAWPALFGGGRLEQRQIAQLEALAIWTESLRDTVAAHASLEQAIPATASHAPPLIRPALVRLVGQLRARVPMDQALLHLAGEMDDPSADLVIAALILNVRRRGDRLAEVLTGLARAARDELDLRRRVSAGRAELRRGVQIVVAVTVTFALFLAVFGGDYIKPYDTPAGQFALLVVMGIFVGGFAWMRRLSGADTPAPILERPGQPADPD